MNFLKFLAAIAFVASCFSIIVVSLLFLRPLFADVAASACLDVNYSSIINVAKFTNNSNIWILTCPTIVDERDRRNFEVYQTFFVNHASYAEHNNYNYVIASQNFLPESFTTKHSSIRENYIFAWNKALHVHALLHRYPPSTLQWLLLIDADIIFPDHSHKLTSVIDELMAAPGGSDVILLYPNDFAHAKHITQSAIFSVLFKNTNLTLYLVDEWLSLSKSGSECILEYPEQGALFIASLRTLRRYYGLSPSAEGDCSRHCQSSASPADRYKSVVDCYVRQMEAAPLKVRRAHRSVSLDVHGPIASSKVHPRSPDFDATQRELALDTGLALQLTWGDTNYNLHQHSHLRDPIMLHIKWNSDIYAWLATRDWFRRLRYDEWEGNYMPTMKNILSLSSSSSSSLSSLSLRTSRQSLLHNAPMSTFSSPLKRILHASIVVLRLRNQSNHIVDNEAIAYESLKQWMQSVGGGPWRFLAHVLGEAPFPCAEFHRVQPAWPHVNLAAPYPNIFYDQYTSLNVNNIFIMYLEHPVERVMRRWQTTAAAAGSVAAFATRDSERNLLVRFLSGRYNNANNNNRCGYDWRSSLGRAEAIDSDEQLLAFSKFQIQYSHAFILSSHINASVTLLSHLFYGSRKDDAVASVHSTRDYVEAASAPLRSLRQRLAQQPTHDAVEDANRADIELYSFAIGELRRRLESYFGRKETVRLMKVD